MYERVRFLLSKALRRIRPPALRRCDINKDSCVLSGSDLTDVKIGRYSYCGYNCQIVECEIGSFCSIADGVAIGRGEHPISAVSTSPVFHSGPNVFKTNFAENSFNRGGKTIIGNDVWIGLGVIVKAGVKIGDGAVIGAGSVVTKDVAPYTISAGVPAKEIRKRFDEATCQSLLEICWWDWPDEKLKAEGVNFTTPQNLISRKTNTGNLGNGSEPGAAKKNKLR